MFYNYTELSKCELFSRIPLTDIPKAIKCLKGFDKTYKNGESVFYPGIKDFLPGVILSGELQVFQIAPDGTEVLLRTVSKGEFFGYALCFRHSENVFVTCQGPVSILFLHLPTETYQNDCTCKYRMIILENLIFILSRNNVFLNDKIEILTRPTLREKILLFLNKQSKNLQTRRLTLNMTREKLAQSINAERSALCRELGRLEKEGIIKFEGPKTIILN